MEMNTIIICKSCKERFFSRGELLLHLTTCKPKDENLAQITILDSVEDGFEENTFMDIGTCIDETSPNFVQQKFIVIGTECFPSLCDEIAIDNESLSPTITDTVAQSKALNDEEGLPSPNNECIDNPNTDPDWTPANEDDISDGNGFNNDEISSSMGVCSNLSIDQVEEAVSRTCDIGTCIDETSPNFVQQKFIVIGTECFPSLCDEIAIDNESLSPTITDTVAQSKALNDEEGLPSPNNECIDNPITDPDWTPGDEDDDDISDGDGNNNDVILSSSCMGDSTNRNNIEETITTTNSGEENRKRWSRADPNMRDRAVQKKRRNTGQDYEVKEKHFPAKSPKESCNIKCRYKCSNNFSAEERRNICAEYWALETYIRKKDFILKNVESVKPERRRSKDESKLRKDSKKYFFLKDGLKTRVCQKFFLNTICISNGPVNTAFKELSSVHMFSGEDKRGKHSPSNKVSQEDVARIKSHIESFPLTESHYCRKGTSRKYLDSGLSIHKMYSLFKELCSKNDENAFSLSTYKKIFCTNYNYSFFKPKKDQCSFCTRYTLASGEVKTAMEDDYTAHKEREKEANQEKELDKVRASNDKSFVSVTFDLQKVLQIPCSEASPMFYSRKLNCFNLTVYESAEPNDAHCFVWNEVNGKRGSLEIGTCIHKFLIGLPKTVKQVSLFSDTCGGQNRNQNMVAILLYTVQSTQIDVIEQKFLESGHTMMQCDSMHSAIEFEKKHSAVYTMHDWINIFRRARSQRNRKNANPYNVNIMTYKDFIDITTLAKSIIKNKRKDTNGNVVNWLKVKCFRFEKTNPDIVFFRYGFSGPYSKLRVTGRSEKEMVLPELKNSYTNYLQISLEKYNDLNKLCRSGVIPSEFHKWYECLPCSKRIRNINPEPSVLSESENEED